MLGKECEHLQKLEFAFGFNTVSPICGGFYLKKKVQGDLNQPSDV